MKGNWGIIIVLGLVLFLASMEQANAIFNLPTEITQEELTESYIQEEIFRLEQLRNEIYYSRSNPYDHIEIEEKTSNNQILDNYSPNSLEYFPKVIDYDLIVKQINIATQKLDEILGGKSTANSDFYKTKFITSSTSKFLVDNQTSSMKRTDEGFQNYKDEQIVALEKIKDELMEQNRFVSNQKNYVDDITKISDKKLNIIKKQLEKFELNTIKIEEKKYDIKESHKNQIKELDEQYNVQKIDVITSYKNKIQKLDEQYNVQKIDEQYNVQKIDEQYNVQKIDETIVYKNKIQKLDEQYNVQKLDERYHAQKLVETIVYKNKIQKLDEQYNVQKLDERYHAQKLVETIVYKNKIQKLDEQYNVQKIDETTSYENKIRKLNNKLINSDPKISNLIAIKLKNEERAISHNLVTRDDSEFINLMESELLLAEKTRDNTMFLTNPDVLNPYIIENTTNAAILLENDSIETVTPVETTKINLVLSWSDQNVVLELQGTLNRNSTNFEDFKLMQAKLAQIELNKMLHVENSENTEPSDSEQTDIVISDGPYFNAYNRGDFLFEFNKNMQKIIAEKKFIELFGNEIQNKDFDKRD